jgi:multiple sugar transport system ATP-binding protein
MTMGDRVAVMRKGELQQVATPQELYDHPVNLFVGGFIGSPAMNLLRTRLVRDGDALLARFSDTQVLEVGGDVLARRPDLAAYEGREVVLGIRPEHLEDATVAGAAPAGRRLAGRVTLREALGSEIMMHLVVEASPAVSDEIRELAAEVGTEAPVAEHPEAALVGRFSPRSRAVVGDTVEVVVDTSGLHFFDPDTGLGIYDQAAGGGT